MAKPWFMSTKTLMQDMIRIFLEADSPDENKLTMISHYYGKKIASRLLLAHKSNRPADLLCSHCRKAWMVSKFDGQNRRITILESDHEIEASNKVLRNRIIKVKLDDERNNRPLKGQYSTWKRRLAKELFGDGYNRSNLKRVEVLVKRLSANIESEGVSSGHK